MSEAFQGAICSWVSLVQGTEPEGDFMALGDGVTFVNILAKLSPDHFDTSRMKQMVGGNSILRKSNLDKLITMLSTFLNDAQEDFSNFSVADYVSSSDIAEGSDNAAQALVELATFVFTIVVTSGSHISELMKVVRSMPKSEQVALQGEAKKMMRTHNIKKAALPAASSTTASPTPESSHSGNKTTSGEETNGGMKVFGHSHHHHDPSAMIDENKKLGEQLTHSNNLLAQSQATHEELQQKFDELDRKYKKALDQGSVGQSAKERELYERLDEKSLEIQQLEGTLEESRREIEILAESQTQLKEQKENFLREVSQLQDQCEAAKKAKQEALEEASMAKDKTASNIKRREELETEAGKLVQEKKILEEKYAARKKEVEERNMSLAEAQRAAQKHKREVSSLHDKLNELESAQGLASNFGAQGSGGGDAADVLREELVELRQLRDSDKERYQTQNDLLQSQLDLLQAKMLEDSEGEPVVDTAAVAKAEALAHEWEKKYEQLQLHLQESVASNSDLRSKLVEVQQLVAAQAEKNKEAEESTQQYDNAASEASKEIQRQNEELKERIQNAKAAAKVEQAAIFSAFFECGHRSLQVQQRQLMGPPSVPSGTLFDVGSEESTRGLSFMEKQRRSIEHSMLLNLATPVSSGSRGFK